MAIGYIYKITYIDDGRVYIGQKLSPKLVKSYWGSGKHLKEAIKRYGIEHFTRDIIEWCDTRDDLNNREKYWISFYDSQNSKKGFNILPGGVNAYIEHLSEDHKKKIGESMRGQKRDPEQYVKGVNVRRENGSYEFSEEHKRKLSESHKGQKAWNKGISTGPDSDTTKQNKCKAQKIRWSEYKESMTEEEWESFCKLRRSNWKDPEVAYNKISEAKRVKISDEDLNIIITTYKSGYSVNYCAELVGIGATVCRRYLIENNVYEGNKHKTIKNK